MGLSPFILAGEHIDKAYAAGKAIHREIPPIDRENLFPLPEGEGQGRK